MAASFLSGGSCGRSSRAASRSATSSSCAPHYALTLRRWIRNLESHHDAAVSSASEFDYRVWRIYMAGSAVGFETGSMAIVQVLGHKPGPPGTDPPLGRAWIAPAP